MEATSSDHLPIFLDLRNRQHDMAQRWFRLENTWLEDLECVEVIQHSWDFFAGYSLPEKIYRCGLTLNDFGGGGGGGGLLDFL